MAKEFLLTVLFSSLVGLVTARFASADLTGNVFLDLMIFATTILGLGIRFERFFYIIPFCLLGIQILFFPTVPRIAAHAIMSVSFILLPVLLLFYFFLVGTGVIFRFTYDYFKTRGAS